MSVSDEAANGYGVLDRALHRLAFSGLSIQRELADIEFATYRGQIEGVPDTPPVFITSLPRSGTTLLLELFAGDPAFAANTYREMPFPLLPLLWNAGARPFRQQETRRERAHGDGMDVGFDSPEAFEEIIWKLFWPKKYRDRSISLWSVEDAARASEFLDYYRGYRRRLIALRRRQGRPASRYVAKNNANIARLDFIQRAFPDSVIMLPFRNPVAHAGSMFKQHLSFGALHRKDAFASRYMADLGHYEFGACHRPIDFVGRNMTLTPDQPDYWLDYWCAAFRTVLHQAGARVRFLSFDALCREPAVQAERLMEIGLAPDVLASWTAAIGAPSTADAKTLPFSAQRLDEANGLFLQLMARAG